MRANGQPRSDKPLILLVAEAVTLAHFGRIVTLANWLDPNRYQVVVASDPRYAALAPERSIEPLYSIPTSQFEHALATGRPVYDDATLVRYVEDDLSLIDRIRPDLIIGDFRLSLAISAPLRKIPYAALVNAYWSPYAKTRFPVPDIPLTRWLGVALAQHIFDAVRPMVFKAHAQPLNRVRRRFGLPAIKGDLREAYSWGDATWYADMPDLLDMQPLPPWHRFIGPVLWASGGELPDWWSRLPEDRPLVVVSLGSSGRADFLMILLAVLSRLGVAVVVLTAGKVTLAPEDGYVFSASYLPIDRLCERAALVICNGGNLTTYWALTYGVPVLGICTNLDQLLNMSALQRRGVGCLVRAQALDGAGLERDIRALLTTSTRVAASAFAARFRTWDSRGNLDAAITDLLG